MMSDIQTISPAMTDESVLVQRFDDQMGLLPDPADDHWKLSRHKAIKSFADVGFPTKKTEAYKYTPITRWIRRNLAAATERIVRSNTTAFDSLPGQHIYTTDGQIPQNVDCDLPEGLLISTLQETQATNPELLCRYLSKAVVLGRDPFADLASALADDGILIHVSAGAQIPEPLYIHHNSLSVGGLVQPRILIIAEEGSRLNIVEHYPELQGGASFENRIVEAFVGPNASINHILIYERNDQASFVNGLYVQQSENSVFNSNTITLGGGLVRNNLNFLPNAEFCETHLNGLYVAKGKAHIDIHSLVDHAKPNCFSNELFKGIVTDEATGVFNGKVLVRQDAQKTNAYQSSKNILLDRRARIYAKPELEIYADDVKCSHGATTGELDDEALFYLRSRGIRPERARLLLLEAFARDVIDLIDIDEVRDYLYVRLQTLLATDRSIQ